MLRWLCFQHLYFFRESLTSLYTSEQFHRLLLAQNLPGTYGKYRLTEAVEIEMDGEVVVQQVQRISFYSGEIIWQTLDGRWWHFQNRKQVEFRTFQEVLGTLPYHRLMHYSC